MASDGGGPLFKSYRDLLIWQKGMDLAEACYKLTEEFPSSERFGLVSQIRRAAASIPSNIAEGHGREQTGAFVQFLRIAQGSLKEVETHLLLATRVSLVDSEPFRGLLDACDELGRMIRSLIRKLDAAS